jgi:Kazal-type serine protease inhibitor domain
MIPDLARPALAALAIALSLALLPPAASAVGVGETCGGLAGIACDAGLWCEMPAGSCNATDMQGTCVRVPQFCTREYRPVCGCDQRTYGNDCERRATRVAKNHDGPCR